MFMDRPSPTLTRVLDLALAVCAAGLAGCCSSEPFLDDYTLATPRLALDSFKKALAHDDLELEFKALSYALRDETDLTFHKYQIGRDPFLREHRSELEAFMAADIERVEYLPGGRMARVVLASDSKMGEVILVNEPLYRYLVEDPAGGTVTFEGDLRLDVPDVALRDGATLSLQIPLDDEFPTPQSDHGVIVDVRISRAWRFYDLLGIRDFQFGEEKPDQKTLPKGPRQNRSPETG